MCGIAGILGRVDDANQAALGRMSEALVHRGPDGHGRWISAADADGWGCLLAHRRLSILDLSAAAAQPMTRSRSGHTLVYNGELYNYKELRRDLEARGDQLRSSGDTEVLLALLARNAPDVVSGLRGMFAFGLWDPTDRSLTLGRDPLGIKPLFVATTSRPDATWSLAFASEVRALLHSGLIDDPRLDPEAVASVVWNGFVVGPGTAIRQIELIPPATIARYDRRGVSLGRRRYWSRPAADSALVGDEDSFGAALRQCVGEHLVSDVPLGVFLSSGIDSSAVANIAQQVAGDRVSTFTLAFTGSGLDESDEAGHIASAIGTEHHRIELPASEFVGRLDEALGALDQPTFDGLNTYFMARAVRDAGITVALVGTGGDELFGGYESFRQLPRLSRWLGIMPTLTRRGVSGALRSIARIQQGTLPAQTRWAKLPGMVAAAPDLISLYQLSYALFLPEFQRRLLAYGVDPLRDGLTTLVRTELEEDLRGRPALSAISILEQRCFLGERLLRDSDVASMAVGLELRLPLTDHLLTDAAFLLPEHVRYAPIGRKSLLRRTGLGGLDPGLFARPKQGFVLPIDSWLRSELKDEVTNVLTDRGACDAVGLQPETVAALWDAFRAGRPGLYWTRIWALYVLVRWAAAHGLRL